MNLLNETGVPAELFRTPLADDKMLGIAVAKVTYVVGEAGELVRDEEAPLQVFAAPEETPLGVFPADAAVRKPKVDLFVLGHARPPGGRPVRTMDVRLQVGAFVATLRVTGKRAWVPRGRSFAPCDPVPFTEMPLTWEHAYGGHAQVREDMWVPHTDNPKGKGYVLDPNHVEGIELPNLEDPAALLQTWEDRPRPVCFAPLPLGSYLHAEGTYVVDPETQDVRPLPSIFNFAHPKHRIPKLEGGELVELRGTTDRPLRFAVPKQRLLARVQLEDRKYEFVGAMDSLCILPDTRQVVVVHRASFTYAYVREEIRTTALRFSSSGAAA